MSLDSNVTYNQMCQWINNVASWIKPSLGELSGEIFGGIAVTLVIIFFTFLWKFFVFLYQEKKKRKKSDIYLLMPIETDLNREHLAHQINGFKIFLNIDTNKNLDIKFVMVQDLTEISTFLNLIKGKDVILITSMSFVFNHTLALLLSKNKSTKKISNNIKLIGTLGSESKEHKKAYHPSNIIRIFPPDYDEAKIAYEFFYHKLLSYFCSNEKCEHSYLLDSSKQATVTIYHSQSYGSALNEWFRKYHYNNEKEDEHNSFGEKSIRDFMNLKSYDLAEEDLDLNNNSCFHFIFIVGYEPNISSMIEKTFKEIKKKNIDIDKICFLFSPTVEVNEWKEKICNTISEVSKSTNLNMNSNRFFYLKSKIPTDDFNFKKDEKKSNVKEVKLNFYNYRLKIMELPKSLKDTLATLTCKPNYINAFAYTSLKMAKLVKKDWNRSLYDLKREAFVSVLGEKDISKPKIYANGDSIEHFIIRPFICDNVEVETTKVISKKRKGKKK